MTTRVRKGALVATVANPAPAKASTAKRKSAKPKAQKPKPKVSNMAQKKKKKSGSRRPKKSSKKRPRQSNPANPRSHGMLTLPRGTMLVPVGHAKRGKRKGGYPRKRNPGSPPHHEMLKNGAAAVAFGTLAATAGMLGGLALTKANIKNKWANVGANVAAGAIVGGGVGMLDRAAGTVTAHNYMVAAGQWLMQPAQSSQGQSAGAGASPQMLRTSAPAMHGADDDMGDPPWEAIAPPRPNPGQRRAARQLQGYRGVSGLGSPLDNLGDGDELGAYAHVNGLGSPLDQLGSVMADDVGSVMADDVGDGDELGDDVDGFEHLNGVIADDVGGSDELGFDDLGDDELAAAAAMDDDA